MASNAMILEGRTDIESGQSLPFSYHDSELSFWHLMPHFGPLAKYCPSVDVKNPGTLINISK
jgi:hypothetical protein